MSVERSNIRPFFSCSLPAVLKGRGRPAFDAISQPLKAALNRLDSEAQVTLSSFTVACCALSCARNMNLTRLVTTRADCNC